MSREMRINIMAKLILIISLLSSPQVVPDCYANSIEINFLKNEQTCSLDGIKNAYTMERSNEQLSSLNSNFTIIHSNLKTKKLYEKNYSVPDNNSALYINGCFSKTTYDLNSSNPRRNDSSSNNCRNINYLSNYLPLTSIGYLNARVNGTTISKSTCFLIGNGLALTAAHCLYSKNNGYYYDITAQFNKDVKSGEFKTVVNVTDFYIPNSYIINSQSDEDWAILKFDSDLTKTLGCLTIASGQNLNNVYYTSVGFPYDKGEGDFYESTGYYVKHDCDKYFDINSFATSGMSGGPVIGYYFEIDERDPNVDLTYALVVGINSKSLTYTSSNIYHQYTRATKIQNSIIYICNAIGE